MTEYEYVGFNCPIKDYYDFFLLRSKYIKSAYKGFKAAKSSSCRQSFSVRFIRFATCIGGHVRWWS